MHIFQSSKAAPHWNSLGIQHSNWLYLIKSETNPNAVKTTWEYASHQDVASKEGLIPVLVLVSDFYLNWIEGVQGGEKTPVIEM